MYKRQPSQSAKSDTEFALLDAKATRFAEFGEWASTSAMLTLMLDMRPDSASLYARAIIAEGMRHNSSPQQQLLNTALEHGVPLDSVITGVRTRSISLGRADIYETFLTDIPQTLSLIHIFSHLVIAHELMDSRTGHPHRKHCLLYTSHHYLASL